MVQNVSDDDELERLCDPNTWRRMPAYDAGTVGSKLAQSLRDERRLSSGLTLALRSARRLLEAISGNITTIADTLKRFEE